MFSLRLIRWAFACLALFAYAANGAQAHIAIQSGETLTIAMCGVTGKTVTLDIEGSAPEEMADNCCGDCTIAPALMNAAPLLPKAVLATSITYSAKACDQISPRSPLWPGAPPQGPPVVS